MVGCGCCHRCHERNRAGTQLRCLRSRWALSTGEQTSLRSCISPGLPLGPESCERNCRLFKRTDSAHLLALNHGLIGRSPRSLLPYSPMFWRVSMTRGGTGQILSDRRCGWNPALAERGFAEAKPIGPHLRPRLSIQAKRNLALPTSVVLARASVGTRFRRVLKPRRCHLLDSGRG